MTDQTDTLAALQTLLAQQQAGSAPAGWNKPATSGPTEVSGVSIPISLETPAGKIRVYLQFPGSCAATPQALMALVEQLASAGMPIDVWKKADSGGGWGGGNNGGNGGGNWNNNRNGYGRRW